MLKNIIKKINSMCFTEAEIDEKLNSVSLYSKTYNPADYVVEQGTSGIWTYRKWNSGIAECKGVATTTLTSTGDVWVSPYYVYSTVRPNYPFPFVTAPVEVATPVRSSANSFWLYSSNSNNTTTQTDSYKAIKLNAFTKGSTLTIAYEVIGRWK